MDRLQLMLEADRRGLLPPEQKTMLDEAVKRGLVQTEKPAVVSFGESLRSIPRQVGLAVRHGAEGLAEVADIGAAPIAGVYNTVADLFKPAPTLSGQVAPEKSGFRFSASPTKTGVGGVLDLLGVPTPQNPTERVVGDASRLVAGAGGLAGGARTLGNMLKGPAREITTAIAANPGQQAVSAAGAGGAGGSVREAGGDPLEQFGASVAGGLSAYGLSAVGMKAYDAVSNAVKQFMTPKMSNTEVNVMLTQILNKNGIEMSQVPGDVRAQLASEVRRSLDTGKELNPDVIRRIADYAAVGATPTRGTVTLDPVQITQERNLAKIGANSSDPKLQELARVQNRNNSKFIENLNTMGGNTPNADPLVAGRTAVGGIRALDETAATTENSLYKAARDSSGRAIKLDSEGFVYDAYNRLAESNKGAFLPENIQKILDQIRSGKVTMGGKEYDAPFTVDTIDSLKTTLATASRASADGNVRSAIKSVRDALENVQPRAIGRPVGGNQVVDPAKLATAQGQADTLSAESMAAFDEARKFARGRRTWQESAPGITAALDDPNPDRFVRDYILSNTDKSQTAHVERLLHEFHANPAALQAVKENVVGYLKSKALGGAADEVGNFSQAGFNGALKELGDAKLRILFSADEISKLKALGRVSSYEMVQPKGSAVNNSNTASAFASILEKIASSPLIGKIPFGEAAVRVPAKNWSASIGVKSALDPFGAATVAPESVKQMRLSDLIGPSLLLSAPRANGRNDEKRN